MPCLHKAGLLKEVGILRVVVLMVTPKKAKECIWMLCSLLPVSLCTQALLSDIASKEQEVQKVSATAQQYQQAVKVRTKVLPVRKNRDTGYLGQKRP